VSTVKIEYDGEDKRPIRQVRWKGGWAFIAYTGDLHFVQPNKDGRNQVTVVRGSDVEALLEAALMMWRNHK
jgi:hypothetical protein